VAQEDSWADLGKGVLFWVTLPQHGSVGLDIGPGMAASLATG
jgi:hypothetical protein